jgi:hypothetical protein
LSTTQVDVTDSADAGPWVQTTMKVTHGASGESRKLSHYWYTGWPDHGVPATAAPVLAFLRAVRLDTKGSTVRPYLVSYLGVGVFFEEDSCVSG